MIRRLLRPAAVSLGAIVMLAGGLASPASAEPDFHPSRLAGVGDARQVIVVTAPDWRSTTGTLRAYEREPDGSWRRVMLALQTRIRIIRFGSCASWLNSVSGSRSGSTT